MAALEPKPLYFYLSITLNCSESSDPSAFPSISLSITFPIMLPYFFNTALSRRYYPAIPLHLRYFLPLVSSFISHNHPTIHQFVYQPHPSTWYLPAVANPAQGSSRLAARRHAAELHLAALHSILLHLHGGRLRWHQNRQRRHLVVRGVRVELAKIAALIPHADVGQCDAHQAWREEHHLEAVVLQS